MSGTDCFEPWRSPSVNAASSPPRQATLRDPCQDDDLTSFAPSHRRQCSHNTHDPPDLLTQGLSNSDDDLAGPRGTRTRPRVLESDRTNQSAWPNGFNRPCTGSCPIRHAANAPTYMVCRGTVPPVYESGAQPPVYGFPHVFGLAPDFAPFPPAIGFGPCLASRPLPNDAKSGPCPPRGGYFSPRARRVFTTGSLAELPDERDRIAHRRGTTTPLGGKGARRLDWSATSYPPPITATHPRQEYNAVRVVPPRLQGRASPVRASQSASTTSPARSQRACPCRMALRRLRRPATPVSGVGADSGA